MIDIETMGTRTDAAIVSVACAVFDPVVPQPLEELSTLYEVVDLRTAVEAGGTIDPETVYWWLEQGEEARKALLKDVKPIQLVLNNLLRFLTEHRVQCLWACDPDFDVVILRTACERSGLRFPIPFYATRSVRTVRYLAFEEAPFKNVGVAHRAMDDVYAQVAEVWLAHQKLLKSA